MEIVGTAHMQADRATAWAAFHDPGVLLRTIPGVESLTELEEDRYAVRLTMGVASIKGTYDGEVGFRDQQPKDSFMLRARGSGGPGTISADIRVRMADAPDGGTAIEWTAEAVLGGAIGGVGQRMLSGVGKRIAAGFFADIDRDIATGGASEAGAPEAVASAGAGEPAAAAAGVSAGTPRVWSAPAGASASCASAPKAGPLEFAGGMLAGAVITLAGVFVGARSARR